MPHPPTPKSPRFGDGSKPSSTRTNVRSSNRSPASVLSPLGRTSPRRPTSSGHSTTQTSTRCSRASAIGRPRATRGGSPTCPALNCSATPEAGVGGSDLGHTACAALVDGPGTGGGDPAPRIVVPRGGGLAPRPDRHDQP